MRPERSGGVPAGAELMAGARPGLWRTPTPYLFLGFASMMGLIVVALLVLICTRRKASPSRRGAAAAAEAATVRVLAPLDREPKFVVIMAGDALPSFLASAMPLAAFADKAGTLGADKADAGAAAEV
ncbi:hypothetical protein BS78_10G199000 [Paspalum vaginatum]|nr:hypothetical protein BS78_10G199000 [Paspalum vaginatum]